MRGYRSQLGNPPAQDANREPMSKLHIILMLGVILWTPATTTVADDSSFHDTVVPIFQRRCLSCHNDNDRKGDFSLASWESIEDSGMVEAGDPEASHLIDQISPDGSDRPAMPKDADPLTKDEVAAIREWIAAGAKWPAGFVLQPAEVTDTDWWSLLPLARPNIPTPPTDESSWIRTPIDAFVLQRQLEKGIRPAPEANGRTLIRRIYFDLIGLPPSPEDIEEFLHEYQHDADRALSDLVDRLLASTHYGERWARHWLDIVHYGDSHGYDKDKLRPNAWPYRDYVIRSLNSDKPYGRFVKEQLAGDVLYPDQRHLIPATGFIAAGPWDFIGHHELPETKQDGRIARNLDRDDMVVNTMQTFCSVTVGCARCHNHKFDSISQEDYYSLQAVFAAIGRSDRPYDPDPQVGASRYQLTTKKQQLISQRELLQQPDTRDKASGDRRQAQLSQIDAELEQVTEALTGLPERQFVYAAATHFDRSGNHIPTKGVPKPIHVLKRGNIDDHLQLVGPGTLRFPNAMPGRFALAADHTEGDRRIALANWIVDPQNPLTWRSIVNRIWLYHFGRGIVDSPSDLGRMGQKPTHPALLDWLAIEFRDGGAWIAKAQSIKQLHKLIVTSATYRQASNNDADSDLDTDHKFAALDGDNAFYWRANRRRLEAEAIRDATLWVAGKLDRKMFGPGFQDFVLEQTAHSPQFMYAKHDPDDPKSHRRTVYRFLPRSQPQPFMETLDCADPSQQVAKRDETVTALSALALLNNKFMVRMAEHFAARLEARSSERTEQIDIAIQLALGRPATSEERAEFVVHADKHGLASACRLILNLNEFVFVD